MRNLLLAITLVVTGVVSCSRERGEIVVEDDSEPVARAVNAPTETPNRVEAIAFGISKENRVRVRTGPGTETDTLGHLYVDDLLEIVERSKETFTVDDVTSPWHLVRTVTGLEGWAFGGYIEEIEEDTYLKAFSRRSVATIPIPWEQGAVTEESIENGEWGPERGGDGVRIDFTPAEVTAVGGRPLRMSGLETDRIGVWRVRNGYLVTELRPLDESAAEAVPVEVFMIWNIHIDETSLFAQRVLRSVYEPPRIVLYDAKNAVPAGTIRRIDDLEVVVAGLRTVALEKDTAVRLASDVGAPVVEFTYTTNRGRSRSRKNLPKGHNVVFIASHEHWYYIDTNLGDRFGGPQYGWIDAEELPQ